MKRYLAILFAVCWVIPVNAAGIEVRTFFGLSDASAGVMLDDRHFVAANDENNTLRIYALHGPSQPVGQVDLDAFLAGDAEHPEADIEGAARVDNRIYWITSHGRNKDGKERPSRYALFATDIVTEGRDVPALKPIGKPYRRLAYDIMFDAHLRFLGLEKALRVGQSLDKSERKALAPKENGLNIEGLAAGPNGSLLVGLRNPTYRDPGGKKQRAILLVLQNPDAMLIRGQPVQFGEPILLDADGLGIRSIEQIRSAAGQMQYLIAAGTANGKSRFAFFKWAGGDAPLQPLRVEQPDDFTPEAMFQVPLTNTFWILSDDGTIEKPVASPDECLPGELLKNGMCPNKYLVDPGCRTFRAIQIAL